jgi:PEGA domain
MARAERFAGGNVKKLAAVFLVLMTLGSGSCATLLKGRTDQVTVITDPPGAKVSVNGEDKGTAPVSFDVPSKEDLAIHVAKDGYQPQDLSNPAKTRWGWEAFSFFSYVIPVFVDMGTGAAWGHDELTMTTHLEPASQTIPGTASDRPSPASAQASLASASPAAAPSPLPMPSPAAIASIAAVVTPAASASPAAAVAHAQQ